MARLDLLGLVFILTYGVINVLSPRSGTTKVAKSAWIFITVFSMLYLVAQSILQIMYKYVEIISKHHPYTHTSE